MVNKAVTVTVGDAKLTADARTFSTGSRGYWTGGKAMVNGERCQVSCSIVVIGSKPETGKGKHSKSSK